MVPIGTLDIPPSTLDFRLLFGKVVIHVKHKGHEKQMDAVPEPHDFQIMVAAQSLEQTFCRRPKKNSQAHISGTLAMGGTEGRW